MSRQPGRTSDPAAGRQPPTEPPTGPGDTLDGRYRLVRELRPLTWSGIDELLDRPVEIRQVAAPAPPAKSWLDTVAAVGDGRWLRLLDVIEQSGRQWLIVEDPCRLTLAERLASGPLEPDEAVELAEMVATALAELPAGVRRGALTPDQVYPAAEGVRLDGLATLPDGAPTDPVVEVGSLLFAALTSRWPGRLTCGLPATSASSPRRISGGISRRIDAATAAALGGGDAGLPALIDRLAALPRPRPDDQPTAAALGLRRWSARLLPPLLVLAIGAGAWSLGKDLGQVPGTGTPAPTPSTGAAAGTQAPRPVWQAPPVASVLAGPTTGQPSFAVDRSRRTAWSVAAGVTPPPTLLVSLQRARTVSGLQLVGAPAGMTVQVRAGDKRPTAAGQLPLVGGGRLIGAALRLQLRRPVTARYWALVLRLPAGQSQLKLAELRLLGPGGR